jgi:aspartate racemase
MDMKTIGILGGLGPQATMDFEARIHRVSQRLIPQQANSGYPPMIVVYHRRSPVLVEANGQPIFPLQPDPLLLELAKQLGALADFLVITANGPHSLQAQIEAAAGVKVLSMIAITLAEVQRRGWQKIGILGLGKPTVYLEPLTQMSLPTEILPDEHMSRLDAEIFKLMAGQEDAASTDIALEMINYLRAKGVDGVIPGCTEIPLLLGVHAEAPDLVNPAALLAEAAVRYAIA